jgi:hypothetical protein
LTDVRKALERIMHGPATSHASCGWIPWAEACDIDAAFKLIDAGLSPTEAAAQVGLTVCMSWKVRFSRPATRDCGYLCGYCGLAGRF